MEKGCVMPIQKMWDDGLVELFLLMVFLFIYSLNCFLIPMPSYFLTSLILLSKHLLERIQALQLFTYNSWMLGVAFEVPLYA